MLKNYLKKYKISPIALLLGSAISGFFAAQLTAQEGRDACRSGMQALQQGVQPLAEKHLLECLQSDSTYYDAYIGLARIYIGSAPARADSLLQRAQALEPDRIDALFEYSRMLDRLGRKQEAYGFLREVVRRAPETAAAHLGIGLLRMDPTPMMDLQEAKSALETARTLEPANYQAAFSLGRVHLFAGHWGAAAAVFGEILQHRPENFSTHYQLGMAHYLQGDYGPAVNWLRKAVDLAPTSLEARWSLGLAHRAAGGYPEQLQAPYRLELAPLPAPDGLGLRFDDAAPALGLDRMDVGLASAWADWDGDGDLDLFASGRFAGNSLYDNEGGAFVERPAGLPAEPAFSCAVADYDNDGAADLFITRDGWFGAGANALLHNNGEGTFTDGLPLEGPPESSFTAAWGDVDNNGFVDLFVANGVAGDGTPNRLYRNGEGKRLHEVGQQAGIRPGRTVGSALGDYDNDGDLDLYLAHFDAINTFYRNDTRDGQVNFVDVTRQTRTQLPIGGYFTFLIDYDNDGHLDLFCSELSPFKIVLQSWEKGRTSSNRNRPVLYHNEGDGTFADVSYRTGLGVAFGSTGAQTGDFNGDGYPDIYLANGGEAITRLEPDALLLNGDGAGFARVEQLVGLDQLGKGHGMAVADYDGDGDEDIYVPVGGAYPGDRWANRLWRNLSPPQHWGTARLVGRQSNRDGIGARLRVVAGGRTRHAVVSGSGGYAAGNSLQVEMGLGAATKVESLEIRWPSGRVETWRNLPVDQVWVLEEGAAP
ncbi:MAG: tetratricopeptide repeat protein [Candidatus Latescibacteria bacterium]|nr:tetratricopeptide repeat protein [Candidatus Latescibacterota bacterium]